MSSAASFLRTREKHIILIDLWYERLQHCDFWMTNPCTNQIHIISIFYESWTSWEGHKNAGVLDFF